MAIINECVDATVNAGAYRNYSIVAGGTYNDNLGVRDTEDSINLQRLTPGTTYTVAVTVDDLAGFSALTLINHADFHSITILVTDGFVHFQPDMING